MDGGVADTTCYTQAVNRQKVGGGNQLTIVSKPKHGAMLGVLVMRVDADGDADDMRPRAICVTGATASLTGDILVHEHLLFDFTSRLQQAASPALANDLISLSQLHQIRSQPRHCLAALRSPGVDVLMQELAALRDAAGPAGCTVVDCTVVGRDAEGLLSLSQLTKVNRMRTVLMNHLDDLNDIWEACSHMPARVTQEQFSRHLRRELPEMRLSRDVEEFLFEQVRKGLWKHASSGFTRSLHPDI